MDGPPDPGTARSLDELAERLRRLKVWAGGPSFDRIKDRVNAAWTAAGRPAGELTGKTTVLNCFQPGRRRVDAELLAAVVLALHPDPGYAAQWRQALRVIGGEIGAAAQVRVHDRLPADPDGLVGRVAEAARIRGALGGGPGPGTVVVTGMAGVGKTRLAVHAAREALGTGMFERLLYVNLRGFHPDAEQPPAEPAAVLDGFLRLLGVAGQAVPHDEPARVAAYRRLLAGSRTLVVLDNAADAGQAGPLLPDTPGCAALITSRRRIAVDGLHLAVDVFGPGEARELLARDLPGVPAGPDPRAAERIAERCGHLPLALTLLAGHMRATPGWTLTDHADRLDERHRTGRLDGGVELALDVSYRHLPDGPRRLLRLAALHPGDDFDAGAAAALTGGGAADTAAGLERLGDDNLLRRPEPGRYTLHDTVRAYAAGRAADEEPPPARRAALDRLAGWYLGCAAAAMGALYPADAHRRPAVAPPAGPAPDLRDPARARAWLAAERQCLVATAVHGPAAHAVRLSGVLVRYLNSEHFGDALIVHERARHAARELGDRVAEAQAMTSIAVVHLHLEELGPAAGLLHTAVGLFRQEGDRAGEARALVNLGVIDYQRGDPEPAARHYERAATLFEDVGHGAGQAHALSDLGRLRQLLGEHGTAVLCMRRALELFRAEGDEVGEAWTLGQLGDVETLLGQFAAADARFARALEIYDRLGDRSGRAWTLQYRGNLRGAADHRRALELFREVGDRPGEATALNSLGDAEYRAGDPAAALARYRAGHDLAAACGDLDEQAHAFGGLGRAHHGLGDAEQAQQYFRQAIDLYTRLRRPEAAAVRDEAARLGV